MAEKPVKRKHVGSYTLGATIGQGAFGKVKLGTDIFTAEKVAVKIIRYKNVKTEKEKRQIEREQNILLRLKHPNIVNLKKVVNDEKRGRSYMIFEYASQGELFDYIVAHGRLSERDARKFMRQIVSALEYCHSLLIIHRDLKPENLLLDEGYNIKISDFGLSNIMEPGKRFNTFCGSLHYACPEILRGEEYVGPGVDIWSIGVILYCLVVGRQPWDADNAEGLIHAILEDGLEVPSGLSDDCVDLLLQMLRVSEYDRIPISKIRTHPWILEGYGEPPTSYLPPSEPITEIDESILDHLVTLNFLVSNESQYLDAAREELLSNKRTQLVVVYNLLVVQKREKQKQKEQELELERKAEIRKKETETQTPERQPNTKSGPASLASSSVATTTKKKTKKSIVITSRGEATPEKHKKKSPPTRKAILSPLDKVVASSRQRSNSLTNDGKSQYEEDDDDYSTEEEDGDQQDSEHDTSSEDIEELQDNLSSSVNPTLEALNANRQRSASMSPHNPRPVIDFDELIAGKLTPVRNVHKKRSQTPQKIKRPVLSEELFIPPEGIKEVVESINKVNHLSEVQGGMNLVPDNISSKPLDQIVEEVVRVLNKEEIKHRKRKHKFIWKCSAEITNETVQLELEIMNVKNNMYGIMVRRIQGSFPTYQVLYNRIKKGLDI